jgi:hypothetical protein
MKPPRDFRFVLFGAFALALFLILDASAHGEAAPQVRLFPAPDGGIQPQAAVDNKGVVHLIYYKGDPAGGDIFYVRREPGQTDFSKPLAVNTKPRTAMAMGTIRGAQLAVGKNGRVHVAWDGMGGGISLDSHSSHGHDPASHSRPTHEASKEEHPLFYTRLNDAGTAFEPERNVITYAYGLDGGSSVAADPLGNVYVTWHAPQPGNTNGEAGRAVFVARSTDEGKTFSRETLATTEPTGACGCCGLRAFADSSGAAYILFRAAGETVNRDETLLVSPKPGAGFKIANRHEWKATTCPMSSASLTEGKTGTLAAWETASQVYFASVDPKSLRVSQPVSPPGGNGRKHPVAVANDKGQTLMVWAEGTGWNQGGTVVWQIYDQNLNPTSNKGREEGLKPWSLPTAFAERDGNFSIAY